MQHCKLRRQGLGSTRVAALCHALHAFRTSPGAAALAPAGLRAHLPLLWVPQRVVRSLHLLELLGRLGVTLQQVGGAQVWQQRKSEGRHWAASQRTVEICVAAAIAALLPAACCPPLLPAPLYACLVGVWVILLCQLVIFLLDLAFTCITRDAKHRVIVKKCTCRWQANLLTGSGGAGSKQWRHWQRRQRGLQHRRCSGPHLMI